MKVYYKVDQNTSYIKINYSKINLANMNSQDYEIEEDNELNICYEKLTGLDEYIKAVKKNKQYLVPRRIKSKKSVKLTKLTKHSIPTRLKSKKISKLKTKKLIRLKKPNKLKKFFYKKFFKKSKRKGFFSSILSWLKKPRGKKIASKNKLPVSISKYSTNIAKIVNFKNISPYVEREQELSELIEILVRRNKNCALIVGETGVGKTSLIELFATNVKKKLVPFILKNRIILKVHMLNFVLNTSTHLEFETRFTLFLRDVAERPHIILYFEDIHTLHGLGSIQGSLDAEQIFKPILLTRTFQCIATTTINDYDKLKKDPAIIRKFKSIRVTEPSEISAIKMLFASRFIYEHFHNLIYSPESLVAAVEFSSRYIKDKLLPDKAFDILDQAGAKQVLKQTTLTNYTTFYNIINPVLRKLSKLKDEAFRRSDIASQFIFQEIEHAYSSFLLTWLNNPKTIPLLNSGFTKRQIKSSHLYSPITQYLYIKMRRAVLSRVNELFFANSGFQLEVFPIKQKYLFSIFKIFYTLSSFIYALHHIRDLFSRSKKPGKLLRLENYLYNRVTSLHRIASLIFLFNYISENIIFTDIKLVENLILSKQLLLNLGFIYSSENSKLSPIMAKNIIDYLEKFKFLQYLRKIRKLSFKKLDISIRNIDNFEVDYEHKNEQFNIISELELIKMKIFQEFLQNLKPLLNKTLIKSLHKSIRLDISKTDLTRIYYLLGYYSTDKGKDFLFSYLQPKIITEKLVGINQFGLKNYIKRKDIIQIVSILTDIPVENINDNEQEKLLNLEFFLHNKVTGQTEAVNAIARAIRRSRLGIRNPGRPVASFLFCGPTGVGKTEACKTLAETMFGSENEIIRLDMSEFMEKFAVSRLLGSPPGYVGHDSGGELTDAVKKKPFSVVLFDEIEKAHPDVLNILLQILDDGRLTDSQKNVVSFQNAIVIMTSNVGAADIFSFVKNNPEYQVVKKIEPDISSELEKDIEISSCDINEWGVRSIDPYLGVFEALNLRFKGNILLNLQKKIKQELKKPINYIPKYLKQNFVKFKEQFREKYTSKVESTLLKEGIYEKEQNNEIYYSKDLDNLYNIKIDDNQKISQKILNKDEGNNMKSLVLERLREVFLPEFLNRIDEIIIFNPLSIVELYRICNTMISIIINRLASMNIFVIVEKEVIIKIVEDKFDIAYGARPLRRAVTQYIEDLIADLLLNTPGYQKQKLLLKVYITNENEIKVSRRTSEDLVMDEIFYDNISSIEFLPNYESLYNKNKKAFLSLLHHNIMKKKASILSNIKTNRI